MSDTYSGGPESDRMVSPEAAAEDQRDSSVRPLVLDEFIESEIKPLDQQDDNIRFFDHRREWARTDFENGGLPRHDWEALLTEAKRRADKAGHFRFA